MDEEAVAKLHLAAATLVERGVTGIHPVPRVPVGIADTIGHIRLARLEGGNLPLVEGTDRQACRLGNAAYARRKPAAAQVIFQQAVHAVHRAPHRPAGNDQMVADRAEHVAFLAEGGEIDLHVQPAQMGIVGRE